MSHYHALVERWQASLRERQRRRVHMGTEQSAAARKAVEPALVQAHGAHAGAVVASCRTAAAVASDQAEVTSGHLQGQSICYILCTQQQQKQHHKMRFQSSDA